jgi:hypothetical protein
MRSAMKIVRVLAVWMVVIVAMSAAAILLPLLGVQKKNPATALVVVAIPVTVAIVRFVIVFRRHRQTMRESANRLSYRCGVCEYALEGLQKTDSCPECGGAVKLIERGKKG